MANGNSPFSKSGISSLLRGSQSTASKLQSLQDSQAAFEWSQSAKTAEDLAAYEQYLNGRLSSTTDPSEQLAYTKAISSARSGYVGNEIQRQSINVIEGAATNRDKYNALHQLFNAAVDNGNYDLAQSLHLQLDNLSVTIQNEDRAAAEAGSRAASAAKSANDKYVKAAVEDAITEINNDTYSTIQQYQQLGPSLFAKRLKEYGIEGDFFGILAKQAQARLDAYRQGLDQTSDEDNMRTWQGKINSIVGQDEQGRPVKPETIAQLPGVGGITYNDLINQVDAARTGQALFIATANGRFKRQNITGYAYGRDENGNYKQVAIYGDKPAGSPNPGGPDQKVKVNGKTYNLNTYKDLLNRNGFQNVNESNGFLSVTNNGEFDKLGFDRGAPVELYVDRQGNLQVKNGDKTYSLQFDGKTGKYVRVNEQTPNPITLLGDQLSAPYINTLDQSKLNAGTIGVIDATSRFARSTQPGAVLGAAIERQQQLQAESQARLLALQRATAAPQAAPINLGVGNFNVQSSPAKAITIAKPAPLPNITIARPAPLPNLTVSNKPNTQTIKVNTSYNLPNIRI